MIDQLSPGSGQLHTKFRFVVHLAICLFLMGCGKNESEGHFPGPKNYNLNRPVIYKLPAELDEISGIFYYPKDKSIFAIHDERGWLYKIYLGNNIRTEKWKFSHGADFEDLTLVDSTFFVIKSSGNVDAFKFASPDSIIEQSFHIAKGAKKEFETLFYDSTRQLLLMICKDCEADEKNTSGVFAFDYKQLKFLDSPVFTIDGKQIEKKLGDKIPKFKPSAAGFNPKTGELYIISSVNKVLVIADKDGKVEDVFPLDEKLFKQPEGLAFTSNGDMLISNESAGVGPATILLFKYKESPQQ